MKSKNSSELTSANNLNNGDSTLIGKKPRRKTRVAILWVMSLLLLLLTGYLIYTLNQNNDLQSKLDQSNSNLRADNDRLDGKVSKLSKDVQELKLAYDSAKIDTAQNNSVELEEVMSAFHLDTNFMSSVGNNVTYGKDQRGYNTAYIELAVVNKGSKEGFISSGEFKLKDSKDITYEMYTEQIRDRAELRGKQLLQSQSLAPGERTIGLIAFQVPSEIKQVKLYFKSKVYDVTLR